MTEFMLDTANLEQIKKYNEILPLSGVTTNPSIIKKEGKINYFKQLKEIRAIIGKDKTLHAQVVATDYAGMLKDAEAILNGVDKEVYIKVPVNEAGLKAIKELKKHGVHVTATAIYSKIQAYLAIAAGADYLAPYFNRMENLNIDAAEAIYQLTEEIARTHSSSKVLAASFKNVGQINAAIESGAQAITAGPDVMAQALGMPSVQKAVDDFASDWESIYGAGSTISTL